jgi:hypothetical protein
MGPLKEGQEYFCIEDLGLTNTVIYKPKSCDWVYKNFNIFNTEEDAENFASWLLLVLKIYRARNAVNKDWKPNPGEPEQKKYGIHRVDSGDNFYFEPVILQKHHPLCFSSEEDALKFVKLVPKEDLAKFWEF